MQQQTTTNQRESVLSLDILKMDTSYLVLAHSVTQIEDDPLAYQHVVIYRVVVKTVVGLAPVL